MVKAGVFMKTEVLYFSAAGTTKRVAKAVARGLACETNFVDITPFAARSKPFSPTADLLVLAVPVYGLRIPKPVAQFLGQLQGQNTPFAAICVYGNIRWGAAPAQIARLAQQAKLQLIAMGIMIGQHTFASKKFPVALGRPDETDLKKAEEFGHNISAKLAAGQLSIPAIPKSLLPANMAYPPNTGLRFVVRQPTVNKALCTRCGLCPVNCPTAAIDPRTLQIRETRCLRCGACVAVCNYKARSIGFRFSLAGHVVTRMGAKRKEPLFFV